VFSTSFFEGFEIRLAQMQDFFLAFDFVQARLSTEANQKTVSFRQVLLTAAVITSRFARKSTTTAVEYPTKA
jgi:hypothetical protein